LDQPLTFLKKSRMVSVTVRPSDLLSRAAASSIQPPGKIANEEW
jgi:hypothetical protein